jgi:DNA-binding transcriptional LysR family regulator
MDLNDIVVFTKVVETRSFTGAADLLGLPKSTVSRKLAQLEERLGVRLVQRTTRKLALTEIGEAYYERCARIVADVNSAEQLVTDMQSTPRGRVRVTAPVDLSTRYLGSIIIAVRIGPLPESTLIARRLCTTQMMLAAAPAYLAKRGTPTQLEELEEHDRLLFTPTNQKQQWTIVNGDQSAEYGRPARFSSNNYEAVRAATLAGGGVGLLAEFMLADDIASGRLVRVLPAWSTHALDVHAVYVARANLPPRLGLFLDHLVRALDPPPWPRL